MKIKQRLAVFLAFVAVSASPLFGADQGSTVPTEYELKSAFLYNFAKFVEWPGDKLGEGRRMSVCILGDDPFGLQLDQMMKGKTANGHELVVRRTQAVDDLRQCHIAFISEADPERMTRIIRELSGDSVLTVGDAKNFAALGGMINFVTEQRKVRFEINVSAAEQRGLRISSKLLKLATIVR